MLDVKRVLDRLAFGPSSADLEFVKQHGLPGWVEDQTRPDPALDKALDQKLASTRLRLKYGEKKDEWPARDELLPLDLLNAPIEVLTDLAFPRQPIAKPERERPRQEVMAATLTRAVHSRYQLQEVMADFWHNHFNVGAGDFRVGFGLPVYDREVIRPHLFGNFRVMLEAVAKSACMLSYLNNKSSKAGAPNENYARELFELHTMGRGAYLNNLYDKWREVPGALQSKPVGYIDQDIYEAARAFTGWSMQESPDKPLNAAMPVKRGQYVYVPALHDNYQKRVLANEFEPFGANEADGQRVLDLVAFHPATAQYLCRKLCMRLLGASAPESLVQSAAQLWARSREHPQQLRQVISHIANSEAMRQLPPKKIKRPLELMASFSRSCKLDLSATDGLLKTMEASGQRLFSWPSPDGHPESDEFWCGLNVTRRRWALVGGLLDNSWATGAVDPFWPFAGKIPTVAEFLTEWSTRFLGEPEVKLMASMVRSSGANVNQRLADAGRARTYLMWFGMSPGFQYR